MYITTYPSIYIRSLESDEFKIKLLNGEIVTDPGIIEAVCKHRVKVKSMAFTDAARSRKKAEEAAARKESDFRERQKLNLGMLDKVPFEWEEWRGYEKVNITHNITDGTKYLCTCIVNGFWRAVEAPYRITSRHLEKKRYRFIPGGIIIETPVHMIFWPIAFTLSGFFGFLNGVIRDLGESAIVYTGYRDLWDERAAADAAKAAREEPVHKRKHAIEAENDAIKKWKADVESKRLADEKEAARIASLESARNDRIREFTEGIRILRDEHVI